MQLAQTDRGDAFGEMTEVDFGRSGRTLCAELETFEAQNEEANTNEDVYV